MQRYAAIWELRRRSARNRRWRFDSLASGINNTFRQLGIAIGIAGLGAIFEHQASQALGLRAGIVGGLDSVLAVAAATAFLAAVVAWPLLGSQRSASPP